MSQIYAILVGLLTGILSGFGIGGGTLLMLYIAFFTSIAQREAQGINLLYFIACAPASLYSHIKNHFVKVKPALYSIGAGIITSIFSAMLANSIDTSLLRRLFGILLLYTGLKELFFKKQKNKPTDS
ncbi:MAG: sulfite exporter TauE/SafE family protein [Clostridiales bacterium]|nr:sulfite exporter TauE/SafE family protein [Clostridiales bacterium]